MAARGVVSCELISREGETMTDIRSAEITGNATMMACPKCTGVLYEVLGGNDTRFSCKSGHSYTLEEICPGLEESLGGLLNDAIGVLMKR
jgi:two-component system chemotaxis response regulator CheB